MLLKRTLGNTPPRVLFEVELRPPNAWSSSRAALSLAILPIAVASHLNRRAISPYVTFSFISTRISIFWPKLSRVRDLLFESNASFLLVPIIPRPCVLSALRLPVLDDLPPRWRLPLRWRMFGRCGASAHRCQGLQLLHIVRGDGDHTHCGTYGHREPAACDLESGTVRLQHMAWCMVLGCGAEVTFGRWWKGPRAVVSSL